MMGWGPTVHFIGAPKLTEVRHESQTSHAQGRRLGQPGYPCDGAGEADARTRYRRDSDWRERPVTDRDIVCKGLAQDNFDARSATARDVMTPGIHCCREEEDLAKAVRHMEELQVRRLPVINKSMRMTGMLSLGDISNYAPTELLSECVKSVSAHH
jgi:hypothetical protein